MAVKEIRNKQVCSVTKQKQTSMKTGELGNISTRQLEFVSEVLEKLNFKQESIVKIENVGKAGDNYIANVKRIIVENGDKPFKMIAKLAPSNEILREIMSTADLFHNEHVMYTEVLPKFSELENAANLTDCERLKYSTCYGSLEEAPNEIILLEDLNESNFFMLDRFLSISNDAVKLVLKDLAKLHSLSYVLRYKEPETYTTLSRKLKNMHAAMDNVPEYRLFMEALENDIISIFTDEKYKRLLKGSVTQLSYYFKEMSAKDMNSKFSIIQQGDSWINNILFQFEDDKPVESCMIDYQMSRVSSLVSDIQFFIFSCTDYETRSKNYNDFLDYYYNQLDKRLSDFDLKAGIVYPRDQFDTELRMYGKLSFSLLIFQATILLKESSDAQKFKEAMESLESHENVEQVIETSLISSSSKDTIAKLRDRIEGLTDSFLEYGYL